MSVAYALSESVLPLPLQRYGSRLVAGRRSWQMLGVYGWEPMEREGREYFRIETAEGEELLVYRHSGERGMRELFLHRVLASIHELPPPAKILSGFILPERGKGAEFRMKY